MPTTTTPTPNPQPAPQPPSKGDKGDKALRASLPNPPRSRTILRPAA